MHRGSSSRGDANLSLSGLIILSLASAAAAVVVHELWRPGTVIGAALTPVLITVFAEALRRPAERVTVLSPPVRQGHAQLSDAAIPHDVQVETIGIHRAGRRWRRAVAGGLAAFVLGAAGLTAAEVLLHRSIADSDAGTTLLGTRPQHGSASPGNTVPASPRAAPTSRDGRSTDELRDRRSRSGPSNRSQPTPTPTVTQTPTPSAGAAPAQPTPATTPTPPAPNP